MRIIAVAKRFKKLPSEILKLDYEDFCFDEYCDFLMSNIENENYPRFTDIDIFKEKREEVEKRKREEKQERKEKEGNTERKNFLEMLREKGEI